MTTQSYSLLDLKPWQILTGSVFTALVVFAIGTTAHAQAQTQTLHPPAIAKTKLLVLGVVDHSGQLVSPRNSPGLLSAFIAKLNPDAICIERPPEQAARNDFYEFTYEVQGVILPYVAQHHTDLCPIDWMPSVEDQKLVFGRDLDVPPEIRPQQGPGGFVLFTDPKTLAMDLFAAEDAATTSRITSWAGTTPSRADQDFPRRLYLYRTFLQAERIRAAAKSHIGRTVLVVIGSFHKPDVEAILSHDPEIEIIAPSRIGRPAMDEAERITTLAQRVAVLSFNLLGLQAQTKNVDWEWMRRTLNAATAAGCTAECGLFEIRLDQLTGKISSDTAADGYRRFVETTSPQAHFSWTGVKDLDRLDSYFDPFGNLTVQQRAKIELIRALNETGVLRDARAVLNGLKQEIGERKARQLAWYASTYLGIRDGGDR